MLTTRLMLIASAASVLSFSSCTTLKKTMGVWTDYCAEGNCKRYEALLESINKKGCDLTSIKTILDKYPAPFEKKVEYTNNQNATPYSTFPYYSIINPGASILNQVAQKSCPEATNLLMSKLSPEDIKYAMENETTEAYTTGKRKGFLEYMEQLTTTEESSKEEKEKISKTIDVIGQKLTANCRQDSSTEISCNTLEEFNQTVKNIIQEREDRQKDAAFLASPEGARYHACEESHEAKKYRQYIKIENQKGRISGFVNKVNLKEWGDSVYYHEQEIKKYEKEYKKRTGKNINLKECSWNFDTN